MFYSFVYHSNSNINIARHLCLLLRMCHLKSNIFIKNYLLLLFTLQRITSVLESCVWWLRLLQPPFFLKCNKREYGGNNHHKHCKWIAIIPFKLWHNLKVHAINRPNKSWWHHSNSGNGK